MWLQDPCLFLILKENVAYLTQLSQNALAFINSQRKEKGNTVMFLGQEKKDL